MKLGKNEKDALDFITRCAGWHTYGKERATKRVISSLERKGLIEVSRSTRQFRLKEKKP